MAENPTGKPGIHFPPPLLFVAGVAAAWLLESYVTRIRFVGRDASTAPIETAGAFLIVLGMLLGLWAMVMFVRARTAKGWSGASAFRGQSPSTFSTAARASAAVMSPEIARISVSGPYSLR